MNQGANQGATDASAVWYMGRVIGACGGLHVARVAAIIGTRGLPFLRPPFRCRPESRLRLPLRDRRQADRGRRRAGAQAVRRNRRARQQRGLRLSKLDPRGRRARNPRAMRCKHFRPLRDDACGAARHARERQRSRRQYHVGGGARGIPVGGILRGVKPGHRGREEGGLPVDQAVGRLRTHCNRPLRSTTAIRKQLQSCSHSTCAFLTLPGHP